MNKLNNIKSGLLALIICLSFSLCGCGSDQQTEESRASSSETVTSSVEDVASSVEDGESLAEDETSSVEEETLSSEDETSSAKDEALSSEDETSSTEDEVSSSESQQSEDAPTEEVMIDYGDAESFEAALNEGENLENKVVRFIAGDIRPNSTFGYNVWAGEHLNFVSSRNPDIRTGNIVTVRISTIENFLGSWIISYEKVDNAVIGEDTITYSNP